MHPAARLARLALPAVVVCGAGVVLLRAFQAVDIGATLRTMAHLGPFAPLALAPFLVAMALDAAGLQVLLRSLGRSVPLGELLPIRIATEALHLTAPAGFLVADSACAALLEARCAVPLADGAILAVARRWLVMRGHGAYLVLGAVSGAAALTVVSTRYLGGPWLAWAVGGSALVPLLLSLGVSVGFSGRGVLGLWLRAAANARWQWVRDCSARWHAGASSVDTRLARIGAARAATWIATAAFFGCWLTEAMDTAIVLRLVGGPSEFALALGAEVGISLLRSVGNVAPAGLGVQDAGYAALLPAMGMTPERAAAFVLVKRGKECLWILVGYGLICALRAKRPAMTLGHAGSAPPLPAR